ADLAPAPPAPARPAGLEAQGVGVAHGRLVAVDDVDLELTSGRITALMGRNGAGKSSLLWALQGSGERSRGSITVPTDDGPVDPAQLPPAERRRAVGLVPQTPTDLLYLDSVGAECARADADAGAPEGTCAELLRDIAPGIAAEVHPRDLSEGQRLALVLALQLTADPP